jgi:hypothetical protein
MKALINVALTQAGFGLKEVIVMDEQAISSFSFAGQMISYSSANWSGIASRSSYSIPPPHLSLNGPYSSNITLLNIDWSKVPPYRKGKTKKLPESIGS